jgi:pyridoxal phosphate enzyme (YggS family)
MMHSLQQSAYDVEQRIMDACNRCGRLRDEIHVIAVTKYVSLARSQEVIANGFLHLGENRWQDAKPKWEALVNEPHHVTWHFIGHLQTNKVKDVVGKFQMVHSLDRWSLAEELHNNASKRNLIVPCFVQVKLSDEDTKHGLHPSELLSFVGRLRELKAIQVVGLMTMAPHEEDPQRTRPIFRELREWRDEINRLDVYGQPIDELSMGMSNDFEIAIEEGATWIRLGSVLVGRDAV